MNVCEKCGLDHNGDYGSGRFCSSKCARSFSTSKNLEEINNKRSVANTKPKEVRICGYCQKEFTIRKKRKGKGKFCTSSCAAKSRWEDESYRENVVSKIRERCGDINERLRLKEIGRKGGFGKKGYTNNGVYFESSIEQECFEYLEEIKMVFIPHKPIPNSSKVTDVYLVESDLWIEIDGINRELRKEWLGENYGYWLEKLKIYESEGLNMKIVYDFNEFKELINKGV